MATTRLGHFLHTRLVVAEYCRPSCRLRTGAAMMGGVPRRARQQSCNFILSALAGLAVALATIGAGPSSACAQEATGPYGMQFFVTPYV